MVDIKWVNLPKILKFFVLSIVCLEIFSGCWTTIHRNYYWMPVCENDTVSDRILNVEVKTLKYAEIHTQKMSLVGRLGNEINKPDEYQGAGSCYLKFSGAKGLKIEGDSCSNDCGNASIQIYPNPLYREIESEVPKYFGLKSPAYDLWHERNRWNATFKVRIPDNRTSEVKFFVFSLKDAIKKFLKNQFYTNVVFKVKDIDSHIEISGCSLKIKPSGAQNSLNQTRLRLNEFFSDEYTNIIMNRPDWFNFLLAENYSIDSSAKTLPLFTPLSYEIEIKHPDYNYYHGTIDIYDSSHLIFEMSELGTEPRVKIIY